MRRIGCAGRSRRSAHRILCRLPPPRAGRYSGVRLGLDQTLSRAQALALFTRAAAYAVGREAEVGTLEPGKRADISAFSADFMTCAPADILKAQTVLTMIDGQALHRL
ncbi:amidohydrolase family protein [Hankyongella ginsenosidimutans]|uniref:amidohydrolase family protein n=1 Tax=Hankyongella ginsenosidimutans TaxID=1763828 RepID=UPI001CA355C0|nr:amidohydrolase family protein [Hankyongella ginsenosidimutans]